MLAQLECPLDAVAEAIHLAKTYGLPVVLNPAPARNISPELLSSVDYLTPNQSELALLSGETDVERGIKKLLGWGVRNLIVTLGHHGARVVSGEIDQHIPAYKVAAVDTTAAGDAFNGALAVALAENKPLLEAVRYGMAAGALAVTKRGAQPSLPYREAVEELLRSQ